MSRTRFKNREKGATVVEAALVFPILILILMSILELGMAFRSYLTVSYLSREAARIGGLAGNDVGADCAILLGIERHAEQAVLAKLQPIEIFHSEPNGTRIGTANTATWKNSGDPPQCTAPTQEPDDTWTLNSGGWNPVDREVLVGEDVSPDIIGVRLRMTHNWITGFPPWRGSIEIDETTITRLEPKVFDR